MSGIRASLLAAMLTICLAESATAQEPVRIEFSGDQAQAEVEWSQKRASSASAWIDSVAAYVGETVDGRAEASWIIAGATDETDRIIQISVLPVAADSLPAGLFVFSLSLLTARPRCGRVLDGTQLGAAVGARESARLILHFIDQAFGPEGPG